MNEREQEFVETAQNNEYAELELGDGYVLLSSWESDAAFRPWVILPDDYEEGEGASEFIEEQTEGFMDFEEFEITEQDAFSFITLDGAELEDDE